MEAQSLTWEQQKQFLEATHGHELNKKQALKSSYQLIFLKTLLNSLEKSCTEVHDLVYESYCSQQSIKEDASQRYAYKHYVIPAMSAVFSLRESKSFVNEVI